MAQNLAMAGQCDEPRIHLCNGVEDTVLPRDVDASQLLQSVLGDASSATVCVPFTAEALACWRQHLEGVTLDCSTLISALEVCFAANAAGCFRALPPA